MLVQSRRNGNAAKRFFRKLLKGLLYVPRVIVTDKLTSYSVAHREMLASVEHRPIQVFVFEQSGRELASTHQTAGTCDETVRIGPARATFSCPRLVRSHRISGPVGID